MNRLLTKICGVFGALAICLPGQAEDIDLFLGFPASQSGAPNVLFILDNTSNWTPPFDDEMQALSDVMVSLEGKSINVGLMMNGDQNSLVRNAKGGYVRGAIRPVTGEAVAAYKKMFEGFESNVHQGAGGQASVVMAEAYLYFAGGEPFAGNHEEADVVGNEHMYGSGRCCEESHDVWGLTSQATERFGNALATKTSTKYNQPIDPASCAGNYIIFIGNGPNQSSATSEGFADDLLLNEGWPYDSKGGVIKGKSGSGKGGSEWVDSPFLPSDGADQYLADEWAKHMNDTFGVITHTIDINASNQGQGPAWTAAMRNIARVSGGKYIAPNGTYEELVKVLDDLLSNIIAKDSVFASVALPASSGAQSTFLNRVYIGQFRPDGEARPLWFGNLKQYKLGFDTPNIDKTLRLRDADDERAIDTVEEGDDASGFIKECARSFWTPTAEDDYWDYLDPNTQQRGACTEADDPGSSNWPDGPHVEKGGQAYVTRSSTIAPTTPAVRDVKTCTASKAAGCSGFLSFAAVGNDNIQFTGVSDTTERANLINWARGADVRDEDGDGNVSEFRPSVHNDVVHSQPIAIDYSGGTGVPQIVVFYGSNDGMLRAINGNRGPELADDIGTGVKPGAEIWSFMPPEFYDKIPQLYDPNSFVINFPASGTSAQTGGIAKPYGPEGAITAYISDSEKYLFFGMRRAARSVYAFDVTNFESPSLKWRVGCPRVIDDTTGLYVDTDCTAGMTEMGESWSQLSVTEATVNGNGDRKPVILMGGGYDVCEDFDNNSTANHACGYDGTATKGDVVYVLDAATGVVLRTFNEPTRAVPGRVTVVPVSDGNPDIAFAYVADTGGDVYRISGVDANTEIGTTHPSDWTMTKVASFGCGPAATNTCTNARKFLFGPDVVRIEGTAFDYQILLGSGDREKPITDYGAAAAVQNYFFSFLDRPKTPTWLTDPGAPISPAPDLRCGANRFCLNSLVAVDPNGPVNPSVPVGENGWKMALGPGEQVVSGALTVSSIVNFSTHTPEDYVPGSCDPGLGDALTYNIGFDDGEGDTVDIIGGGLVPTPVAGYVELDDGTTVPFCIGCGGERSAIGGGIVIGADEWDQAKNRVYWKIEK